MMLDNEDLIEHIEYFISIGHVGLCSLDRDDTNKLLASCIIEDDLDWILEPELLKLLKAYIRAKNFYTSSRFLDAECMTG